MCGFCVQILPLDPVTYGVPLVGGTVSPSPSVVSTGIPFGDVIFEVPQAGKGSPKLCSRNVKTGVDISPCGPCPRYTAETSRVTPAGVRKR